MMGILIFGMFWVAIPASAIVAGVLGWIALNQSPRPNRALLAGAFAILGVPYVIALMMLPGEEGLMWPVEFAFTTGPGLLTPLAAAGLVVAAVRKLR